MLPSMIAKQACPRRQLVVLQLKRRLWQSVVPIATSVPTTTLRFLRGQSHYNLHRKRPAMQRLLLSTQTLVDDKQSNDDDTLTVPWTIPALVENIERASKFNQRNSIPGSATSNHHRRGDWDVSFVRETVDQYEHVLKHLLQQQQQQQQQQPQRQLSTTPDISPQYQSLLLSPETTEQAFRALLRCRIPTSKLSSRVRDWEKYLGRLGQTPLTDTLSLRLLEANGKVGNVGRVRSLLRLRLPFEPTRQEFIHAITALDAAGLFLRTGQRNIFLSEKEQPQIDDPTRWLDAILLNMRQRDYPLTTSMANRMLNTYASTGKTGKALHYFYRVLRTPLHDDQDDNVDADSQNSAAKNDSVATFRGRPIKVRINMRPPPPYHKIPSQVRGKMVRKPGSDLLQLKLDRERDPDWSPVLTSAIAFADSLQQGACGHDPIELDLVSYSILIKICAHRGSLWRAMHILDEVLPSQGIDPDVVAYNTLLGGLSRVGDVPIMREYFAKMLHKGIEPTKETVEAIVNGLLNLGDVASAVTVVQDCFNQHSVLPPYTTHIKILEFALGRSLIYEAKRHVYFLQQLWKWERNEYHSKEFARTMELAQKNPKLSKQALQQLFAYFGEELDDSDFF